MLLHARIPVLVPNVTTAFRLGDATATQSLRRDAAVDTKSFTIVAAVVPGVGNSNFYWAMALAFNLTRLAISQSLLVQAREAPKKKKMKKR